MKIIRFRRRYRIVNFLPHFATFWIDIDPERKKINIPATGDLGARSITDLLKAIAYAKDLASGALELGENQEV